MKFHDDLHELTDVLLDVATKILNEQGEFPPFASGKTSSGELSLFDAEAEDDGIPGDPEVIEIALTDGLRQAVAEGELCAVGVCVHVTFAEGETTKEAIALKLDHKDQEAIDVIVPIERVASEFQLGQPILAEGTLRLFPVATPS